MRRMNPPTTASRVQTTSAQGGEPSQPSISHPTTAPAAIVPENSKASAP